MNPTRVVMLGTGTSHGIPMIACHCPVCSSPDPRDRRTRSSILVEVGGRSILIDTTPELRLQCLANSVRRVDAVLYTHHHADHVIGLDDLRRFNALQNGSLTCYGNEHTLSVLRRMFPYAFHHNPDYPSAKPQLDQQAIEGPFEVLGVPVTPVPLLHGQLPVLGFRFGRFAYCTDVSCIPNDSRVMLEGLDILVLDGLRRRPHPTHFNLEQAVEAARLIGAKQTWFTHIAHELMHESTNADLPPGMALAHDEQVIQFTV
ncbi:MAG TPA: MBL fold metallo-hydrolase [Phycisphaerae bacterium]|nr:MBL fold metallo-hydrolase [Phycisphaerae bacterium]HRY69236.1 MBL fold metallo-hydrolase [Phycisphaerae bacterium]HSA26198.1 MBL fold metallo-hydrolase [Phycisphaerae bacterium]